MTFRVGLTGGVASGKSAAARYFAELDVPVIDSDIVAREVVVAGSKGLAAIAARFGDGYLTAAGELDRDALRRHVFAHPEERRALEAILHPLIAAAMLRRSETAGGPYQIWVIPLLVEAGWADRVDRVLVVDCPVETQLARLMRRDPGTRSEAERIVASQTTRAARLAAADDVLTNDESLDALAQKVYRLHLEYLRRAHTSP